MKKMNVFNFDKRPLIGNELETQNKEFLSKVKRSNIKKMEKILFFYDYSDKFFDIIINSEDNYEDLRENLMKLLEERKEVIEKISKRLY